VASPASREFEPARITTGETIAAGSGIALFLFLFFHWFGGFSAWRFFDIVDFLLAAIAVLAVAVAGTKAMGNRLFGDNAGLILLLLGTVASSITVTFVLEGDNRALGLWLSFFASLGLAYGGWRVMHEDPNEPGPLANVNIGGGGAPEPSGNAPTTPMPATGRGTDPSGSPSADPVPGTTGGQTPPGLAGEPPPGEGTRPPGV
jgi:hypothetical protein